MKYLAIKIIGFKSFLDPVEININEGLTGIVGPNGCGKSNIVEAIKWVMGESSAKHMRSNEMNSVIFSGTNDRPSRNFAEVILKIDNSEKKAPYPFAEINELEISRKIERDKGSVYRVNGKIVRARDVQLIFADSGTGSRSSGMVSQGKISEIIDTKPEFRRTILEEAANITGLHSRRHEAELKLNSASGNLERLVDIENTISEQLKDLNKQARQASRYRSVGERLRKAESTLFYAQLKIIKSELSIANEKLSQQNKKISDLQIQIAKFENLKLNVSNEIPNLKEIDFQNQTNLQSLKIEKIKVEQEINSIQDTKESLSNQIVQLQNEIQREKDLIFDASKTIDTLLKNYNQLEKNGFEFTSKLEKANDEVTRLRKLSEHSGKNLSELNTRISVISSNKNKVETEVNEINENLKKIKVKLNSFKVEDDQKTCKKAKQLINEKNNNLKLIEQQLIKNQSYLQNVNTKLKKLNFKRSDVFEEISSIKAEISTLESYLTNEDERSLEKKIDLKQNLESSLASVLGETLSAPVVKKPEIDKEHFWRQDLNLIKKENNLPNTIPPLTEKVRSSDILNTALQGVGIVQSEKEAYELQENLLFGQSITTPKGGVWRWDGYVQTPKAKNNFVKRLTFRKNLKILQQKLTDKVKTLSSIDKKIEYENNQNNSTTKKIEIEINEIAKLKESLNSLNLSFSLAESRIQTSNKLIPELINSEKQQYQKLKTLQENEVNFNNLPSLQTKELKNRNTFENIKREFEDAISYEKQLSSGEEFRKKNMDQILFQIKNWESRKKNSEEILDDLIKNLNTLDSKNKNLDELPDELLKKIDNLDLNLKKKLLECKISSDNLVIKENELREIEKLQKNEEIKLIELRETKVRTESQIESINIKTEGLQERLKDKLKIGLEKLLENTGLTEDSFLDINEEKIIEFELKVERLLRERENIGVVNLRAEIEISELNEKLDLMKIERDDLFKAIEKLNNGILELNKEGRDRLNKSFHEVNEKFKYIFKKLFKGGHGELKLLGNDDPLQSGLEIYASPPGKKMKELSLLSGGEQALTSISLILAVYLCNPSPLCILDEVDAALDDNNVSLFCDLLEQIVSDNKINFIIVTHHRLTMAKMNRLLGVTMQEKGISKLLTVDLEKAVEIRKAS